MNTSNNEQYEIQRVKPAPKGATYVAMISFAFRPSPMLPLKVTDSSKTEGKWRNYTQAEIDGAQTVRVRTAFVRESKDGQMFVQVPHLDVPWDLAKAIGEEVYRRLESGEVTRDGQE